MPVASRRLRPLLAKHGYNLDDLEFIAVKINPFVLRVLLCPAAEAVTLHQGSLSYFVSPPQISCGSSFFAVHLGGKVGG